METRPTLDKSFVVKPSRPGWKAAGVFIALLSGFFAFISTFGA